MIAFFFSLPVSLSKYGISSHENGDQQWMLASNVKTLLFLGLDGCNLFSVSVQHTYYIAALHLKTAAILFTALSKNGSIKSIFHLCEIFFNQRINSNVLILEQNT